MCRNISIIFLNKNFKLFSLNFLELKSKIKELEIILNILHKIFLFENLLHLNI